MSIAVPVRDLSSTDCSSTYLIEMPERFTSSEALNIAHHVQKISTIDTPHEQIVLDFGNTTFMDNDGLLGLCRIFSKAQAAGVNLGFDRFSPQIKILLSLTGLDQVFTREALQPA